MPRQKTYRRSQAAKLSAMKRRMAKAEVLINFDAPQQCDAASTARM